MTLVQIINALVIFLLPVTIWLGYWLAQYQIQRMPESQRAALEQFATMAVRCVEEEHADSSDKKKLAVDCAADLFRLFDLPIPPATALGIAVSAAMCSKD